jgi:hypothetical protein
MSKEAGNLVQGVGKACKQGIARLVRVFNHHPKRLLAAPATFVPMPIFSPYSGVNPRVEFYNKFRREIEGHDRDCEKKYDGDLNTTLIFVSVCFYARPGLQNRLGPDVYDEISRSLVYSQL